MKKISSLLTQYKEMRMTEEEKQNTWNVISSQTFSQYPEMSVRKPILSRLYYRGLLPVLRQQGISFGKEKYALGVMLGTLIVSGTISAFAQDTLPGDFLYPVKTKVNEKIQVVLAVTPEDKAQTEALLATKRLEEVERLVVLGKLNSSLADQTKQDFKNHVNGLEEQLSLLEKKKEFKAIATIGMFFQTRIAVHTAVLKDIEVNAILVSPQPDKNDFVKKIVHIQDIAHLEKSVLSSVVPTAAATKKALLKIATSTEKDTLAVARGDDKTIIRLNINHNEAKEYLIQLHKDIGIPTPILESVPDPIVPVFVPEATQ